MRYKIILDLNSLKPKTMDAYGYLNTRLGGHQAYASKVIDILEEAYENEDSLMLVLTPKKKE